MPTVVLPNTLTELFPGAPRQMEVAGATVREVVDQLDARFPGMRNRICDFQGDRTTIRRHLMIFVDDERCDLASGVGTASGVRIIPALSGG